MLTDASSDNAMTDMQNIEDTNHPQMGSDNFSLQETQLNGEIMDLGSTVTRVELDLACSSEKILNLENLLMHVAPIAGDYEALAIENKDILADSIEKALEFDLLTGILDSEVKELNNFLNCVQKEIVQIRGKVSSCKKLEDFNEIEEKLYVSEESLKQLQEQVSDMKMQSMKFQRILSFGGQEIRNIGDAEYSGSDQFASNSAKRKSHSAEQQRHVLIMLENSLSRELDLERKLSETRHYEEESRHYQEELESRLHHIEEEMSCLEGIVEIASERLFEAENARDILMGISKEMMGKLQIIQLNLNSSIQREGEMRTKLQGTLQKLSKEESAMEKLTASCTELDNLLISQANELKADLKKAEEKYILSNLEALSLTEKVNLLEDQLEESDIKLQHATASVEASQEQQNLLYSGLSDMENVIEDLKAKVLKSEIRADNAETKITLLTETNLELNEELGFLRGRMESMESSFHQAYGEKIATSKDVKVRSKIITDLIAQLAVERERLHRQVSSLMEEKNLLAEKCWNTRNDALMNHSKNENGKQFILFKSDAETDLNDITCLEAHKESVTECSEMTFQIGPTHHPWLLMSQNRATKRLGRHHIWHHPSKVKASVKPVPSCRNGVELDESADNGGSVVSNLETVRTIEVGQLNSKYVFMAILIPVFSALVIYLFQNGSPL